MKKNILIIFLVSISFRGFAQKEAVGCDKFKTGKFRYFDSSNNKIDVKRTHKFQTESNSKTGIIIKFRIRWIEDCTYRISQIWSNSKAQRRYNKTENNVKITGMYSDKYDYTCACKDSSYLQKNSGVMYLVK